MMRTATIESGLDADHRSVTPNRVSHGVDSSQRLQRRWVTPGQIVGRTPSRIVEFVDKLLTESRISRRRQRVEFLADGLVHVQIVE